MGGTRHLKMPGLWAILQQVMAIFSELRSSSAQEIVAMVVAYTSKTHYSDRLSQSKVITKDIDLNKFCKSKTYYNFV